ncbi:16S rRNA (guanine(527)-N(7))-methyltransferase RsmG [Heliobacterium gestii]|uniref:Ribosomal RNA small subunit methyltransferase G n=1 Tax=Heliomicrobium gestii TaxID=2699 RepID=A0A845LHT6_HELGE|nr:16S rRNA (guanine(527)-N(7))-methyltransferase RsmG [Heliomicrobium gestii]MBM7867746.1 16S rRNA (guanine527-N7)-methyltransferase [Heliomicrobium gestii]MZP44139.1 16S rRNA (guanine(527)-N(7))-methyltransferase RsmG [Heliomicrobium gestii]
MNDGKETGKLTHWDADQVVRFRQYVQMGLEQWRIALSSERIDQFTVYAEALLATNAHLNLTSITDPEGVAEKHFVDSMSPLLLDLPDTALSVIDVGTGAGFPGLPLALIRSQWRVVLLDSLQKRCRFLNETTERLGLTNVQVVHGRAEDTARVPQLREKHGLVFSRAVARLPVLLELCLPFLAVGGRFIALKGPDGPTEVDEAKTALRLLGGEIDDVKSITLPISGDRRTLIAVRKQKPISNAYPRKAGIPTRKPLV